MLFTKHLGSHSSEPELFQVQSQVLTQVQRDLYLFDGAGKANWRGNDEVDYLPHPHQKHLIHFL